MHFCRDQSLSENAQRKNISSVKGIYLDNPQTNVSLVKRKSQPLSYQTPKKFKAKDVFDLYRSDYFLELDVEDDFTFDDSNEDNNEQRH